MMSDSETAAEFASDLFSHLDSSAGDYSDMETELGRCEQTDSVQKVSSQLQSADNHLTEAFNLLDDVVLEAVEFQDGNGEFTRNVEGEVRQVAQLLSSAEDCVSRALREAENIERSAVYDGFKFGVHTDVVSAIQYILGDVQRMAEVAREAEACY